MDIVNETAKDPETSALVHSLKTATDTNPELSLHNGIIMRGQRVYIPAALRPRVLAELHSVHQGIVRMKTLARRHVYWPRIDHDIEHLVRSCTACQQIRANPSKVPVHSWEQPPHP
jgi:hypothetical protein